MRTNLTASFPPELKLPPVFSPTGASSGRGTDPSLGILFASSAPRSRSCTSRGSGSARLPPSNSPSSCSCCSCWRISSFKSNLDCGSLFCWLIRFDPADPPPPFPTQPIFLDSQQTVSSLHDTNRGNNHSKMGVARAAPADATMGLENAHALGLSPESDPRTARITNDAMSSTIAATLMSRPSRVSRLLLSCNNRVAMPIEVDDSAVPAARPSFVP
mmetsp:Transcript_27807/g.67624  ORF Transcript_27807/g.67624 Transcript_27807/m.67624 type:complete len:216 (+) Transcript_27807:704-1351(+)